MKTRKKDIAALGSLAALDWAWLLTLALLSLQLPLEVDDLAVIDNHEVYLYIQIRHDGTRSVYLDLKSGICLNLKPDLLQFFKPETLL